MDRTFTACDIPVENRAEADMPRPNGSFRRVLRPAIAPGTVMGDANGLQSTIKDLAKFFSKMLRAYKYSKEKC